MGSHGPRRYRSLVETVATSCVQRIWRSEDLSDADFYAFGAYLNAREASGRRLLGMHAAPAACSDTVTGRCGIRPLLR
ncbi:MAG: hypothetical protein IPI85_08270 [Dehalococcoidia bacterium]|uniref:hypothetical protein n=1 Tax=Candidatus Amarobacter glycogenicus TaxID=3140699 RepID=UPI002A12C6A7|nr:hypothetical protein [Dehalococcoidia bacterium]MBK7329061.1 hypothetical protein [Dehalococcoidia bacterium]MBK8560156.1 hypothetical protein [Dehalococcoidia bacterium]MBK9613527.1 hypothetical protein [Dehalococcoidia bacterium]